MSHPAQMLFVQSVKHHFPDYFKDSKVLEIGSLNINGSVRQFFENCEYLGVDLGLGKDVDLVSKGHELSFPDKSFKTVISCECLEHDKDWQKTFQKMYDLSSGLVVMSCATIGRPEHGTSRHLRMITTKTLLLVILRMYLIFTICLKIFVLQSIRSVTTFTFGGKLTRSYYESSN